MRCLDEKQGTLLKNNRVHLGYAREKRRGSLRNGWSQPLRTLHERWSVREIKIMMIFLNIASGMGWSELTFSTIRLCEKKSRNL